MLRSVCWFLVLFVMAIVSLFTTTNNPNSVKKPNSPKKPVSKSVAKPKKKRIAKRGNDIATARRNTIGAIVQNGKFVLAIEPSVIVEFPKNTVPTASQTRLAFLKEFRKFARRDDITETDVKKYDEDRLYVDVNGVEIWIIEWHSSQRCKCCGGLSDDPMVWCVDQSFHSKPRKQLQKKRNTGF